MPATSPQLNTATRSPLAMGRIVSKVLPFPTAMDAVQINGRCSDRSDWIRRLKHLRPFVIVNGNAAVFDNAPLPLRPCLASGHRVLYGMQAGRLCQNFRRLEIKSNQEVVDVFAKPNPNVKPLIIGTPRIDFERRSTPTKKELRVVSS